jgi:hypothetical protein
LIALRNKREAAMSPLRDAFARAVRHTPNKSLSANLNFTKPGVVALLANREHCPIAVVMIDSRDDLSHKPTFRMLAV